MSDAEALRGDTDYCSLGESGTRDVESNSVSDLRRDKIFVRIVCYARSECGDACCE